VQVDFSQNPKDSIIRSARKKLGDLLDFSLPTPLSLPLHGFRSAVTDATQVHYSDRLSPTLQPRHARGLGYSFFIHFELCLISFRRRFGGE
jgi:hypothetical protein